MENYLVFLGGIVVTLVGYFIKRLINSEKIDGVQSKTNQSLENDIIFLKKELDNVKMDNKKIELITARHDVSLAQHRKETEYFLKALRENTEVTHEMKGTLQQLKELFERLLDGDIKINKNN